MLRDRRGVLTGGLVALVALTLALLLGVGGIAVASGEAPPAVVATDDTSAPSDPDSTPPSPSPTTSTDSSPSASETTDDEESEEPTPTPPTPTVTVTQTVTAAPTTAPAGETEKITNAVLRWGLNNESNRKAPGPGHNIFTAGMPPTLGGGRQIQPAQWRQASGNVEIHKLNAKQRRYLPATWAGLTTDPSGVALTAAGSANSGHQFWFRKGTGTRHTGTGDVRVTWKGTVGVLFYSGMSVMYLTDPILDVRGGKGTLTMGLGGFAASQADPTKWDPVPPVRVTIADLPQITRAATSVAATPAYDTVKVTVAGIERTGSFPVSFVNQAEKLGVGAFWHASGGGLDGYKKALPLSARWAAAADEADDVPTASANPTGGTGGGNDEPSPPTALQPPTAAAPPVQPPPPAIQAPIAVPIAAAAVGVPPVALAPAVAALTTVANRPPTLVRLASAEAFPDSTSDSAWGDESWPWWIGGGLLLATAAVLLVPGRRTEPSAP